MMVILRLNQSKISGSVFRHSDIKEWKVPLVLVLVSELLFCIILSEEQDRKEILQREYGKNMIASIPHTYIPFS